MAEGAFLQNAPSAIALFPLIFMGWCCIYNSGRLQDAFDVMQMVDMVRREKLAMVNVARAQSGLKIGLIQEDF